MSLNLQYLETFVLVVKYGSFSAAADRLGITQPAVSLQIRQLERSLGAQLIERVGRNAKPTSAGSALLTHAGQIQSVVRSAKDAISKHGEEGAGRLRLGTGATACIYLLPPILKTLHEKYPKLEITVTTGNAREIVQMVEENLLDVGLVTLPLTSRILEITPVLEDEFVLIAPREMKLKSSLTADAVCCLPVILFEPGGTTRQLTDKWLARAKAPLAPIMSLGSVEAIKALVEAGLGCAILPAMSVRQSSDFLALQVRQLTPKLSRSMAIILRQDKRLCLPLRDLLAAVRG